MRKTSLGRLLALCAIGLTLPAIHLVNGPEASAEKIRKKPPKHPLPPRRTVSDIEEPGDATTSSAALSSSVRTPARARRAEIPYPKAGLICLYGEQIVRSTKKARCLSPEELDPPRLVMVNSRPLAEELGMLRHTSEPSIPNVPASKTPDTAAGVASSSAFKARVVRVSFENGVVGGALRSLRSRTDDMARCVEDEGGLRADSARLKLLFFVRGSKRASGMIVASARNIPLPVVRCIRKVIQKGEVGRPSTNPVGVKVLIELKQNK